MYLHVVYTFICFCNELELVSAGPVHATEKRPKTELDRTD